MDIIYTIIAYVVIGFIFGIYFAVREDDEFEGALTVFIWPFVILEGFFMFIIFIYYKLITLKEK